MMRGAALVRNVFLWPVYLLLLLSLCFPVQAWSEAGGGEAGSAGEEVLQDWQRELDARAAALDPYLPPLGFM